MDSGKSVQDLWSSQGLTCGVRQLSPNPNFPLTDACVHCPGCKRVFIADINADRLALATKMGADVVINSSEEDLKARVMELTGGVGMAR